MEKRYVTEGKWKSKDKEREAVYMYDIKEEDKIEKNTLAIAYKVSPLQPFFHKAFSLSTYNYVMYPWYIQCVIIQPDKILFGVKLDENNGRNLKIGLQQLSTGWVKDIAPGNNPVLT